MHFTTEVTTDGVLERDFTVGDVPGVLWSPNSGSPADESTVDGAGRAPLVLLCHGGGTHKRWPGIVGRAGLLVRDGGFHVVTLDAPGHADRPRTETDVRETAALRRAQEAGAPVGPIVTRYNADVAERAVPEWRATLDAVGELPEIDVDGPVGYYGINMGTAIGVPLIAVEPRITAAVLGQFWPETLVGTARRITVPIEFALQWDDEHIPRASGLALFDAFASTEKSLHANAGRHKDLPRFEAASAVRFFGRHLRRAAVPAA